MARRSSTFRRAAQQLSPADMPLILIEVSHALLAEPLRFVGDNQDIVSGGRNYVACDFQFIWPDDQDQQAPSAQLSIGNRGGAISAFFERTHGGAGAQLVVRQIMRSRPDFIEDELRVDLRNIKASMSTITGQLSYANILDKPGTAYTYRPETAPGIF